MEQDSKVRFVESQLDFTFLFIPIIQIEFVILPIWKYSSWIVFFVKKRKFLIINDIVEIRHQQNVSNTLEAIVCRHVYKCTYASRLYLAQSQSMTQRQFQYSRPRSRSSSRVFRYHVLLLNQSNGKWPTHACKPLFPIKLVLSAHSVFVTSSEWNVKIRLSDWSICTTWSKYSILIGFTLYRHAITSLFPWPLDIVDILKHAIHLIREYIHHTSPNFISALYGFGKFRAQFLRIQSHRTTYLMVIQSISIFVCRVLKCREQ